MSLTSRILLLDVTENGPRGLSCREWYVRFGSKADMCIAQADVR